MIGESASGVALQICDIFVQELNKADDAISLEVISDLLDPFLKALASIQNKEIKERIIDKVFHPLLENNKTIREEPGLNEAEELAK